MTETLLFFAYLREYLSQKETHERDDHKEDDLVDSIEKYGCNPERESQEVYYIANIRMRKTKLEKTEMEVMRLISLHRIFPFHDADTDDVDEVDEVYAEH